MMKGFLDKNKKNVVVKRNHIPNVDVVVILLEWLKCSQLVYLHNQIIKIGL